MVNLGVEVDLTFILDALPTETMHAQGEDTGEQMDVDTDKVSDVGSFDLLIESNPTSSHRGSTRLFQNSTRPVKRCPLLRIPQLLKTGEPIG
jgi:hypothetical protein